MHPDTKQRLLNTFEIPPDILPVEVKDGSSGVHITWSNDGHHSFYSWDWLENHRPLEEHRELTRNESGGDWTKVEPSELHKLPTTDCNDIMESEAGVGKWTLQIHRFGFSFVTDCLLTPSATEALLNRIAFIRPTHYGAFWDFTSSVNPTDTAYTTLALPVHTDTTYFTDPCGLQMFHLLSHTDGSGGESTLVDGFAAAAHLYESNPDFYKVLSTCKIASHASGNKEVGIINNSTVDYGFPVLRHRTASLNGGQVLGLSPDNLTQVRWNNDDRAATTQWKNRETMNLWYAAARKWTEILRSPDFEIRVQLVPGRPLIFDNWRMLHGRMAFTGRRRVCGGYIGMDDFMARWRMLNKGRGRTEQDSGSTRIGFADDLPK